MEGFEPQPEDSQPKKHEVTQLQREPSTDQSAGKAQSSGMQERAVPTVMPSQYENENLPEGHKQYDPDEKEEKLSHSSRTSSTHPTGFSDQNQSYQQEEAKRTTNEILLKLKGISSDGTILKINIIFKKPSNPTEITFEFDLRSDTSEGVVSELEQAFNVSKVERNQIKNEIDKIVMKAVEKIRMSSGTVSNGSASNEYTKNKELAQFLIHHFVSTIDQEVTTIQKSNLLELIGSSTDNEATNLSLQFIESVIESYKAFQYQMSTLQGRRMHFEFS